MRPRARLGRCPRPPRPHPRGSPPRTARRRSTPRTPRPVPGPGRASPAAPIASPATSRTISSSAGTAIAPPAITSAAAAPLPPAPSLRQAPQQQDEPRRMAAHVHAVVVDPVGEGPEELARRGEGIDRRHVEQVVAGELHRAGEGGRAVRRAPAPPPTPPRPPAPPGGGSARWRCARAGAGRSPGRRPTSTAGTRRPSPPGGPSRSSPIRGGARIRVRTPVSSRCWPQRLATSDEHRDDGDGGQHRCRSVRPVPGGGAT